MHEPLRMPGRMPEGYHRGLHRQDEPRIPRRHRDLRRKGVREGLASRVSRASSLAHDRGTASLRLSP